MSRERFGKNDIIYLSALAVIILIFLIVLYSGESVGDVIVITVDGEEYGEYSLSENQEITVCDADGNVTNVVVIADGKAYMEEADCPDHLCINQGNISQDRQNIVCLPNRVVVTVESSEDTGVDAIAQ